MNDNHTTGTGPAAAGPALAGSDNEALVQALRNLWPILDKPSRRKAMHIAKTIRAEEKLNED